MCILTFVIIVQRLLYTVHSPQCTLSTVRVQVELIESELFLLESNSIDLYHVTDNMMLVRWLLGGLLRLIQHGGATHPVPVRNVTFYP